jgi:hypothetical protein
MTALASSPAGTAWLEILHRADLPEFAAAFSVDVTIEASVLPAALNGAHDVRAFFEATKKMYTSVGFTFESTSGPRTFLGWDGQFAGKRVAGITVLERDGDGRICAIHLHHRPYEGVLAFSAELGRLLKGQLDADPFSR